jgi:hypothetical protein
MSQANVYTAAANIPWYTDKCSISTGNTAVTFNVYCVALNYIPANGVPQVATAATGNIYSNAVSVPANSRQQIYVGAGNYLTITGANFTAEELGTASSATKGVIGPNG